jgi:uncharacterized protein (TIGR03437 family)
MSKAHRSTLLAGLIFLAGSFQIAKAQSSTSCNGLTDTFPSFELGIIRPIIITSFRVINEEIVNGTLLWEVHTYNVRSESPNTTEITIDGLPYTDDIANNPEGIYSDEQAQSIVNSLCPDGVSFQKSKLRPRANATATAGVSGGSTGYVAIADFNGDGIADSAVLGPAGFTVNLIGKNGTPASTQVYPVANAGSSILAADFNQDGKTDIAVVTDAPQGGGSVMIFLGRGDGTFAAGTPVVFPTTSFPFYLAAGDFNRDGKIDLAVSVLPSQTTSAGSVAVLLGKGDGTFAAPVSYPVGLGAATLVSDDFTGDGTADIVVLDARSDITNKVWVLPGNGDGTFRAAVSTPTGTNAGSLFYADFDHDGNLDLMIADQLASSMVLMRGKGDGTFQAPQRYLSGAYSDSLGLIPLGDGNTAIFSPDNAGGNADLFFVNSAGVVVSPSVQSVGKNAAAVAVGDANGDHLTDIAVTDSGSNSLYLQLSKGSGQFAAPVAYSLPAIPGAVALADLNKDGNADAIVATASGLAVLMGASNGQLGAVRTFAGGVNFNSVTVADFNGDGRPDVAAAAGSVGVSIFLGNGDGSLQSARQLSLTSGSAAQATATADVNGDGRPDLIVALTPADVTQPGSIAVLLGNGDGTFQAPSYIPLPGALIAQGIGSSTVAALAVGDVNGDSKPDIVTVVSINGLKKVAVLLNSGNGTFGAPVLTSTNTAPPQILIADLDGNGKPDLLLGDCCGLSEASFLAGNGDGTFQAELPFPSGPNPVGLALADFDGDGLLDLAIVGQIQSPAQGTLTIIFGLFAGPASTPAATIVSSANAVGSIAPGSLASAFGTDLATSTPGSVALPLAVAGTSVAITDAAGKTTAAPMVYVSPGQVNFYVPPSVATGAATVTITSGDGTKSTGTIQIASVAPGLFALNSSALAAADVLVYSGATAVVENVYSVNSTGAIVANPISVGGATDQAYLILFGTGLQAAGTSGVTVTVGGVGCVVAYAGVQGSFTGLDQVNVLLPPSLAGKGNVTVQLTANGIAANPVNLTIQ